MCHLCSRELKEFDGDNWSGLCPSCADSASAYLSRRKLDDSKLDVAIAALRKANIGDRHRGQAKLERLLLSFRRE
jgi:hypothetical protein